MAITAAQTVDIAPVLAELLADIDGLRVEPYVSDTSRPPCAVIALPRIDWADPEAGFCWASWDFPITIITARNSARDAQADLSRLVRDVANALSHQQSAGDGIHDIQMLTGDPTTATIAGQELPAYLLRVRVLA